MQIPIAKIIAALIAIAYAVIAIPQAEGVVQVVGFILVLWIPLHLIWFPEWAGSWTYFTGLGASQGRETHPAIVSFAGWFFLIGLPLIAYLMPRCV